MYDKSEAVYVAGAGVVSAIGNNTAACMRSLEAGEAGIGPISSLDTFYKDKLPVAAVKLGNDELAEATGMSPYYSRTALLSMLAAKEAWQDANLHAFGPIRIGFISANSVGGMDKTENFFPHFLGDSR